MEVYKTFELLYLSCISVKQDVFSFGFVATLLVLR